MVKENTTDYRFFESACFSQAWRLVEKAYFYLYRKKSNSSEKVFNKPAKKNQTHVQILKVHYD
jgi:hypothetical protein